MGHERRHRVRRGHEQVVARAEFGLPPPQPLTTAYTISLATPEVMAQAAAKAAGRALLKIKLGGPGDPERITAVRASFSMTPRSGQAGVVSTIVKLTAPPCT